MPSLSVPFHLSSTDNRNVLIFISKICFVFPFGEWEGRNGAGLKLLSVFQCAVNLYIQLGNLDRGCLSMRFGWQQVVVVKRLLPT